MNTPILRAALALALPWTIGLAHATDLVLHNDFDGDGHSDVLWHNADTGANVIWRGGSPTDPIRLPRMADPDWQVAGTGDFYGARRALILWRNRVTSALLLWLPFADAHPYAVPVDDSDIGGHFAQWDIAGIGEFYGGSTSTLFLRDRVSGSTAFVYWDDFDYYPAAFAVYAATAVAKPAWKSVGTADFDADGRADMLWRDPVAGDLVVWYSGVPLGSRLVGRVTNPDWHIEAVGDFNGDGRADVFWRNARTGADVVWDDGRWSKRHDVGTVRNTDWHVVATGDFDGDGRWDLFWRNSSNGFNAIWGGARSLNRRPVARVADLAWSPIR